MPNDVLKLASKAYAILNRDRDDHLLRVDRYLNGEHDSPYIPESANDEFRELVKKAKTNWIPMLVGTPAQAMYVDSFRRGGDVQPQAGGITSEMEHWQRSRLDSRQVAIHRAAIAYGIAYTRTYMGKDGKSYTKGLSPLHAIALYDDPATDLDPVGALYVKRREVKEGSEDDRPGEAVWYDATYQYPLIIKDGKLVHKSGEKPSKHGMSQCPITRFAPWLDLDGRPSGLVETLIEPQNRFTQTIVDLLMAQSYTSFEVRTVSGMAPPLKMRYDEERGESVPILDSNGKPIIDRHALNASRWMYSEDPDTKFGSLSGGDLSGFLAAAEATLKHMSAISQVPPHFLLGQIANVSAEALQAAQTTLLRMVDEIQHCMGESWERCFRLASELDGDMEAASDYTGEVIWKDVGSANVSQQADALSKMKDLGVPKRGLWQRIPAVTDRELQQWEQWAEEEDVELQTANRIIGSSVLDRMGSKKELPAQPIADTQTNPPPATTGLPFKK